MPVVVISYLFLPDLPETTRARYLKPKVSPFPSLCRSLSLQQADEDATTQQERQLALDRMILEGRANRKPYTREKFKAILTSWHWWILVPMYAYVSIPSAFRTPKIFPHPQLSTVFLTAAQMLEQRRRVRPTRLRAVPQKL